MFRNLTTQLGSFGAGGLGGGSGGSGNLGKDDQQQKTMTPTLRADIYTAIEQAKGWLSQGATGTGGGPGDGVSFQPVLETIQKHFPHTKVSLSGLGRAEAEVAAVVGGLTNMVLEFSKWEGMAGGMAMRRWTDELTSAHANLVRAQSGGATVDKRKVEQIARGITQGINAHTDVTLLTQEFTAKIQIISCLKSGQC
jgi:hypothetical protein